MKAIEYLTNLHAEQGTVSPDAFLLACVTTDIERGLQARNSSETLEFQLKRLALIMEGWKRG